MNDPTTTPRDWANTVEALRNAKRNASPTEHPKAKQARKAAEARRAAREFMQCYVNNAKAQGIRFVHAGNTTVCYRPHRKDVLEFSTALRNPTDHPDRLMGEYVAAQYFAAGHRVRIKNHLHRVHPKHLFRAIFD